MMIPTLPAWLIAAIQADRKKRDPDPSSGAPALALQPRTVH